MFTRRPRRAGGTIDKLPPEIKDTVDNMLLSGETYGGIVAYLAEHEVALSQMSVCRYARRFLASQEQLRMATENAKMTMDLMERYPDVDLTEAILRVSSNNVFSALTSLPAESWEGVDPAKLLREATSLIRTAATKRKQDSDRQADTDRALAANQQLLYDVLAKRHPELYDQLMAALAEDKARLEGTGL